MATTEPERDGPKELRPFHEQEPFLRDDHRYYAYVSGVGAGKTYAGMLRTVLNVEEWNPGEMHAIVAPTTTMIKDVIIPQFQQAGILDYWDYKSAHSDQPGLHAPNGSRVLLLSADNRRTIERLAGLNLASFWLDEASRVPYRALEILEQRLRVGDYQNGYLTTTPMGRDHVYDFCVGDPDGDRWTYEEQYEYTHGDADVYEHPRGDRLALLRVPTWANPYTGEQYKEDMEQKQGQTYEREVLGRFVDYEGLVYSWFDPTEHVVPLDELNEKAWRQTVYGVDWGFDNPAVILVLKVTTAGEYHVIDEFYESGQTTSDMADVLLGYYDRYGRGRVYCDPSEPEDIEAFKRAGIDATGGINDITPGIKKVTEHRESLRIAEHCTETINEFGMYRYPDGGGEKPVDANNHSCDAVRYCIMTHDKHGEPSVGVAFG